MKLQENLKDEFVKLKKFGMKFSVRLILAGSIHVLNRLQGE